MSDGNFNRNLLPYQNYQSGLRAGKAIGKTKAIEALTLLLASEGKLLNESQQAALISQFKQQLDLMLG
ncbi:MAG: hypothetical protein Q4A44_03070 [Bacteroidales bacterium]|nr:hypothetical protein [Bacteroidales bacterium]